MVNLELAELPYIRLRSKLIDLYDKEDLTFEEMVQLSQEEIEQMPNLHRLIIDKTKRQLRIGELVIALTPLETAVYLYYAERSKQRPSEIPVKEYERYFEYAEGSLFPDTSLKILLELYKGIAAAGTFYRFINSLEKGHLKFQRIVEVISRIKGKIQRALNDTALAEYYIISSIGRYGKCYGIKLVRSKIFINGK